MLKRASPGTVRAAGRDSPAATTGADCPGVQSASAGTMADQTADEEAACSEDDGEAEDCQLKARAGAPRPPRQPGAPAAIPPGPGTPAAAPPRRRCGGEAARPSGCAATPVPPPACQGDREEEVAALRERVAQLSQFICDVMGPSQAAAAAGAAEPRAGPAPCAGGTPAAAEAPSREAALLARQVTALRVLLSEQDAALAAAAAREREAAAREAGASKRHEELAVRLAQSEFEYSLLQSELAAARREVERLTGGDGAAAAAREAECVALERAGAAAEAAAAELARILLEREEELLYYRRHCSALEQQVWGGAALWAASGCRCGCAHVHACACVAYACAFEPGVAALGV